MVSDQELGNTSEVTLDMSDPGVVERLAELARQVSPDAFLHYLLSDFAYYNINASSIYKQIGRSAAHHGYDDTLLSEGLLRAGIDEEVDIKSHRYYIGPVSISWDQNKLEVEHIPANDQTAKVSRLLFEESFNKCFVLGRLAQSHEVGESLSTVTLMRVTDSRDSLELVRIIDDLNKMLEDFPLLIANDGRGNFSFKFRQPSKDD